MQYYYDVPAVEHWQWPLLPGGRGGRSDCTLGFNDKSLVYLLALHLLLFRVPSTLVRGVMGHADVDIRIHHGAGYRPDAPDCIVMLLTAIGIGSHGPRDRPALAQPRLGS